MTACTVPPDHSLQIAVQHTPSYTSGATCTLSQERPLDHLPATHFLLPATLPSWTIILCGSLAPPDTVLQSQSWPTLIFSRQIQQQALLSVYSNLSLYLIRIASLVTGHIFLKPFRCFLLIYFLIHDYSPLCSNNQIQEPRNYLSTNSV